MFHAFTRTRTLPISGQGIIPAANVGFESGSNSNGSWIKFPDGTMLCNTRASIAQSQATSGFTWTYPQSFADWPSISAFTDRYSVNMRLMQADNTNSISTRLFMINQNNAKDYGTFSIMAIGRWK